MEKIMDWWLGASKKQKIVVLVVIAFVVIGIVQSIGN
jgi:flagellar biosynthesis/type III secretory pathway M-ring protein FliF/YscJ|tara:strand:+ start:233 stop:343 length:111 start_codon:yes stop_codon:yes gene_type:complete